MRIHKRFQTGRNLVLHHGDCFDLLRQIPDESVDLTITSPPYCIGKEYENTERVEDFVETHKRILPEIIRVTSKGGHICWQVGYHVNHGHLTPLDFLVHEIMTREKDVVLRNRIIWTYGHGLHCTARFSGRHETILWYTKGEDYLFELDSIRIPQKYPGKRHHKGAKKGEFSGNPLGKNPSDVWDIPNIKANHIEKTGHPCQFPVGLALRLVKALTRPGMVVLDPFMGSGTTAVAALLGNRKAVGAELKARYYKIAVKRCKAALQNTLAFRSADKPVLVPDPKSEVARNPFILPQGDSLKTA